MTKTKQLYSDLAEHINALPIAGYLKAETLDCLKYLHRYKLKNVEKNLTYLSDYLLFLNAQNSEKFLALMQNASVSSSSPKQELSYFFHSQKKLTLKSTALYLQKIVDQSYQLLTLMQGIRGILVLTIDEFCNATPTRIDIHQMLMAEQLDSPAIKKKK